MTEIEIW